MQGIGQVLSALTAILPLKVVIGLAIAIAIAYVPFWIESIREKQISGAIRQMIRADPLRREELAARTLALAGTRARRLLVVVQIAIKYDQRALRDRALELLEANGGADDAARVRKALVPAKVRYRDPVEALVRIEGLYADGLRVAADEQLQSALAAFPADPDLAELARRHLS